ncbi:MAG: N-acetyltransferase [Rickettsiales bacterium]
MIIINNADNPDLVNLQNLSRETFTETFGHLYSNENLEYHLAKTCSAQYFAEKLAEGNVILLARDGSELAGYVKYGHLGLPLENGETGREIHRLYVRKAYQRSGLGKRLMEATLADEILKSADIFLGVWENNIKALAFYMRYGFAPYGEYTYFVGTHADREIIMRRAGSGTKQP